MPNREWGRDEEQQQAGRDAGRGRDDQWMRDERWRRDMGRDFSRHEWSPYDRARDEGREPRGGESGFGFGGTDRGFGGGGYGGYGERNFGGYGERNYGGGYGERNYGGGYGERNFGGGNNERNFGGGYNDRSFSERGYGEHIFGGRSMAERSMADRGMYQPDYRGRPMGRPPKGYQRSDERIKEDLCDLLMRSFIDAENVEIQVRAGEVILAGSVEDRQSKRTVEDLAEQVLGVKDVQNNIRVQRRGQENEPHERSSMGSMQKKPTA